MIYDFINFIIYIIYNFLNFKINYSDLYILKKLN